VEMILRGTSTSTQSAMLGRVTGGPRLRGYGVSTTMLKTLAGDPRVTDPPREAFGCARTGALSNTYLVAARGRAGFSASSPSRKRRNATTAASSALIPSISSAR
jgi:hypothetical protein